MSNEHLNTGATNWLVLGLVAGVTCLASNASAAGPTPAKAAAATPAKKKLGPAPSKEASAKVNAYIDVINEQSQNLFSKRDIWSTKIDRKVGPTCNENLTIDSALGPDGGIFDAYRKRLKAKPALPPDAAALKMVDAVEEVRNVEKRPGPHSSYQPGGGKSEAWCTKLKEVYPLLMASFDKYAEGNHELRAYVDTFTDERDQRDSEAVLKKYGKHYRYEFSQLTLEGKAMVRGIREELAKPEPDATVVRAKFASYLSVADESKAMMDNDPQRQKSEPYPTTFNFFLIESVPKLKRASEALLATLALKPDKKRAERLDHDWENVITAYNEIIGYMNTTHFDAKQK